MIRDTVAFFRGEGKRVIYDAEHFYDGWIADRATRSRRSGPRWKRGPNASRSATPRAGPFPETISRATLEAKTLAGSVAVGIHTHNDGARRGEQPRRRGRRGRARPGDLHRLRRALRKRQSLHGDSRPPVQDGKALSPRRGDGLTECARAIAEIANLPLPDDLPYVGTKAFAHKAGMHADGVLKHSASFEHVAPESVGNERRVLLSDGRT